MSVPTPNFVNPITRAPVILGATASFAILATTFVVCRVFIRTRLKRFGVDDILIVMAWALSTTVSICISVGCRYGIGRHMIDIPVEWYGPSGKLGYTFSSLYNPTLIFTKTSILSFYLRLAPYQTFRRICYVFIVYIVLSSTSIFLVNIFGCTPIAGGWNRAIALKGKCVNKNALYWVSGVNNIVTDFLLLLLPIPIVARLRLKWASMLGVVSMFSMGFVITGVSIVRLKSLDAAAKGHDFSWDASYAAMWSAIELSVGVMTACMPSVKIFFEWLFPGISSSKESPLSSGGVLTVGSGSAAGPRRLYGELENVGGSEVYIMGDLEDKSGNANAGGSGTVPEALHVDLRTC